MIILYKLIQAILLGIVMLFSIMLMAVAFSAFAGFIAEMLGLAPLAEKFYEAQRTMWDRIKRWFFRYKDINEKEN